MLKSDNYCVKLAKNLQNLFNFASEFLSRYFKDIDYFIWDLNKKHTDFLCNKIKLY